MRLAQPFGMRLIAHDPYADPGLARELGVELVSDEALFRRSDFLSVSRAAVGRHPRTTSAPSGSRG